MALRRFVDAATAVAIGLHQPDPAQAAFLDQLARLAQVRRTAPLRPYLHHSLALARRGHHGLAFDNVHADRLLHIHVGPGLHRRDHRQGMPMIRRGDQHNVQVPFLQHFAVVTVGAGFLLRKLATGHDVSRLGQHSPVHVAERNHLDWRDLDQAQQVNLAIPPAPDQPDSFSLVGQFSRKAWKFCQCYRGESGTARL